MGNSNKTVRMKSWRGHRPQLKFAIANRSPSDPVSVVGRILATHRGYTDAGSVQARAKGEISVVAYQSAVHRHGVGGAVSFAD